MKKIAAWMIGLLACLITSQSLAGTPAEMQAVLDGFDTRVEEMFEAERGDALERHSTRTILRNYSYYIIGHATRLLYLGEATPENNEVGKVVGMYPDFYATHPAPTDDLNAILQDNALIYLEQHATRVNSTTYPYSHPNITVDDLGKSMILDRDSFHWHAPEIMRLIEMYGPGGTEVPEGEDSPITQATVDLCLQPIFIYANRDNTTGDKGHSVRWDVESSKTWNIYESENHHAMSVATCWYFNKLAKDHPTYMNHKYSDGLTPAQHYEKWNKYVTTYFRERAKKGMLIEMNSGKYNSSLLKGFYNMYDFGEPEVKEAAGKFLDLYFAYLSQEQIDGIQGGGRGRIYFAQGMDSEPVSGIKELIWYYFGIGDYPPAVSGHDMSAAVSSYRPPAIVADLMLDTEGRGTYEVKQFPRGLTSSGGSTPNKVIPNQSGIQRYSYCDPSFILGAPMSEARPSDDWAAISSQNRWQGAIFPADASSGKPATRIILTPKPNDERRALNMGWSVQSKGCLIVQKLGPDYNVKAEVKAMLAWLPREGLTLSKEDGTLFVDSGIPTDNKGNLIDVEGNVIHQDGYRLISDDGYLMDENGDLVLKDGNPIPVWNTHDLVIKNGQTQKDISYTNLSGILFVEAPEAYAAIRTVGNYTVSEVDKFYKRLWDYPPKGWVITPDDQYAPIILEVMSKTEAGTFADFKALVQANTPAFDGTVMSYTSIYGETLTLDTAVRDTAAEFIQTPTINGQAVDYEPTDKVLESPFLNSKYNSGVVTISKPGYTDLVLDFNEPVFLESLTPENTATKVSLMPTFVATFDGDIAVDSGEILLKLSDDSIVEAFDVTDAAEVTITDSQLRFTPSSYLEMNTGYYIEIPDTAVTNYDADFSGNSHWSFTTIDTYPAITGFLPGNGVTNAPLNTPLMATFDVPVQAGSGTILLKIGSATVESFDVTDSDAVTFSGNSVLFPPSVELVADTVYTIEIPADAVRGQNGVFHQGDSWSFTVTDTKALVVVNSASYVTSDKVGSKSYNFAANGDMIVVAFSSYATKKLSPVISYGGVPLTQAVLGGYDGDSFAGIWYLDLTTTDYVAGDAELKVEIAEDQPTGVGIGVVSLSAGGAGIELDAAQTLPTTNPEGKAKNLTLTTNNGEAFHMVSFYGYGDDTDPSIHAPLTTLYATHEMNNRSAGAGYQLNVDAGDHSYSWAPTYSRGIAAASFILRDTALYALTVESGTGDGNYMKGTEVSIAADSASSGYYFSGWTSDNGGTFADASAVSTTFTMPSGVTTITANYALITAPEMTTSVPVDGATAVQVNTSLTATFDMPVQAGSGYIALKKSSDGSTVELFDVTDSTKVSFNGNSVSFTPSNRLELGAAYTVEIPENALQSQHGATNEALSWSFTVTDTQSIVVLNSGSKVVNSSRSNKTTTYNFDATGAEMVVVAYSSQDFNSMVEIRYNGDALTSAVNNSGKAAIWYLDLKTTDYAGGSAALEIDYTGNNNVKGVGVGVVALSAGGAGIDLDATGKGTQNVDLISTQDGAFNIVSFLAKAHETPPVVSDPLTTIYASADIGSRQGAAGYQENVKAGTHNYTWVTADQSQYIAAAAFVIRENSFSGWADQNNLGADSGLDDDPDGDGVPNGIEAVFGSNPGEASSGLVALDVNGSQISFTHPQADPLPSDLELSYSWSIDLINWYDCDGVAGPASGETVSVSSDVVDGTNTVTVTPSAELDCLYLRAKVQQN